MGQGGLLQQIQAVWASMSGAKQRSLMLSLVTVAALVGALYWLTTRETMAPLLTNLAPEDAAQITQELATQQVPYEVAASGTAILVPVARVHELRLSLAGHGLPKGGGVGFELFDQTDFGQSRFVEKLKYRRALEGELRRTLRGLGGVADARVHVALPDRSLFTERDQQPSASVTLQLVAGRRLADEQVQAIRHLVSASIEGLSADDVTIVDQSGAMLAHPRGADATADDVFARQSAVEHELETRVAGILERTLGAGNVSVKVNADLDLSRTERTTETYDPEATVIRSEQHSQEQRGQSAQSAEGIPGSRSNLAGTTTTGAGGTSQGAAKESTTKNYEVSKVVAHEIAPTGRLKRLSVAVLVAGTMVKSAGDGEEDAATSYTPRSADELASLTELVKRAVGFDAKRGDEVVVQSAPFVAAPELTPPEEQPQWVGVAERSWRPAAGLLVAAALMAMLLRRRRGPPLVAHEIIDTPRTVRELEASLAPHGVAGGGAATAGALPPGGARPDPQRAAQVLKGWLGDA